MKIFNNTVISDGALEALLVRAGRSVGARTGRVAVQINTGIYPSHYKGTAFDCVAVQLTRNSKRWTKVDGGYFKITLPRYNPRLPYPPEYIAKQFLTLARHEWGHIRDYQAGGKRKLDWSQRTNGRRPPHDSRPEEIRAENYIYDSDKRIGEGYFDKVLADLASEIEKHPK